jgi:hypothetical protein
VRFHQTSLTFAFTTLLILGAAVSASATLPTRSTSGNGQDSNAASWMLLARSQPIKLSANGKSVMMSREVVCLQQDVEDSFPSPTAALVGSCDRGVYMHLFQFQSTSLNVSVNIGKLIGFVANITNNPPDPNNLGVMLCDLTLGNTLEMCTNDSGSKIPNITFTSTKTSITFTVPNTFPTYPAGTPQEGRGLTFYVITDQSAAPLPMQWPSVGIH